MNTKTKGRVRISGNARELLNLAKTVYEKHVADGTASPLLTLDELSWAITGPKVSKCLDKHNESEELGRKMEDAYRQRDAMLVEINEIIRASKLLLKARYLKTPKKMGGWGFKVDDTPKKSKNEKLVKE